MSVRAYLSVLIVPMSLALCSACSAGSKNAGSTAGMDSGASSNGGDTGTTTTTDGSLEDTGSGLAMDASSSGPTWTFAGGTATVTFTSGTAPSLSTIPAGGDVTTSVQLQFGVPTSSGSLVLSTAENGCCGETTSDVSPTLPPDVGNIAPTPGSVGNNPVLYLSFYNPGTSSVSFGDSTPTVAASPSAMSMLGVTISGMDECQFDFPYEPGADAALPWRAIPGASEMLPAEATSFSIPSAPLPGGSTLTFKPGQTLGAISCD